MLKSGGHPAGLQKWYDRLTPLVQEARDHLCKISPSRLVQRSGCVLSQDNAYRLTFCWQDYTISPPDFAVQHANTGRATTPFIQALILTYLDTADGTPPSGRWIAYRELPNGMFYANAFRGYAENQMVRDLEAIAARATDPPHSADGLHTFRQAAEQLSGTAVAIGDAGYAFQVLPRIHIAAAYWQGDEDLSAQASILFEDSAIHYMSTDGLAVLGSHLVSAIVRQANTNWLRA